MEHRPLQDWEYPEPDTEEDEDVAETRECSACGAKIYEEAERCPVCDEYVLFSNSSLTGWVWWIIVLALLVTLVLVVYLMALQ